MRAHAAIVVGLLLSIPVIASEPGQPIGCEDIQLQVPGLRVRTYAGPSTDVLSGAATVPSLPTIDLSGHHLSGLSEGILCGDSSAYIRFSLGQFRDNGPTQQLLTLTGRCLDEATGTVDSANVDLGGFDWQTGRLYLRIIAESAGANGPAYPQTHSLCVIERFRRLSDIYEVKRHGPYDSVVRDPLGGGQD